MRGDLLRIEYDGEEDRFWLCLASYDGLARESLRAAPGFGTNDIAAALIASGWVCESDGELRTTGDHNCRDLRWAMAAMLDRFDAAGSPTPALLHVRQAVAEYYAFQEAGVELSWFDYAWLDVQLRDAIIDEARTASDIWSDRKQMTFDIGSLRDSLVSTAIMRHAAADNANFGRLAGSRSTRSSDASRSSHAG